MDVTIKGYDDNLFMIEVGVDDTTETMRQKVASAVGLAEDSFHMGFGGKDEGEDITQLSAGDTIILTKTKKYAARAELHALGETDITAERLEEVDDPEVACLLLQAEVATVIPDDFLSRSSLTRLDLSAVSCVTEVGDSFLYSCTTLTSIDLSGLSNVTRIGDYFLSDCKGLTTLDLSPLSNLTRIGSNFLYDCKGLTTLDLSALSNFTEVGDYFLYYCEGLTTLDLSPLSRVKVVDSHFLTICTSLKSIYLTGCSSAVSDAVRNNKKLSKLVVEARPKRSRDESPQQAHKRQRHTQ